MIRSPKARIKEEYHMARQLFHAGKRELALKSFSSVLDSPNIDKVSKLDAACSIGEVYRGRAEFQRAHNYYKLAIQIARDIPIYEQRGNEFFRHYCPRAYLGLIMTTRRALSKEHFKIFNLLKEAKEKFADYGIRDLNAQFLGLEGLYLRQLGEIENSISYLEECIDDMRHYELDYVLFLYREHYEALLLMSYACQVGGSLKALRIGRKLIKENIAIWSTAVASMSVLHIQIKKAYRLEKINKGQLEESIYLEVEESFKSLRKAAQFEQDPLILTEGYILEVAWSIIAQEYHTMNNALSLFFRELARVTEPILILRAIELAILKEEILEQTSEFNAIIQSTINDGKNLLDKWFGVFQSFNCKIDDLLVWRSILHGKGNEDQTNLSMFFHNDIYQLRSRVWS